MKYILKIYSNLLLIAALFCLGKIEAQAQPTVTQDAKELMMYLTNLKNAVNQGQTKFTLLDLNQIKDYLKYVPIPLQQELLALDLSDISVWWSSAKKMGGIDAKSNLIGQPVEVHILLGYNLKGAAPTLDDIKKAQQDTETATEETAPEQPEATDQTTSETPAQEPTKPAVITQTKDSILAQLKNLQLAVVIGIPEGFKFGTLASELSLLDTIRISKGAISLTEATFQDPVFGEIGEGLGLVLQIDQNLQPFNWIINFINKSKSPIKISGTTIDLRGSISPTIGGSQFLLQLPGVISFQMAGQKIVESDRPSIGIVLLPSLVPGTPGVGGIRIGLIGGMKIYIPKMDPLDFTMEMAFDSSSQATITGQMAGLFDLKAYGLPFGIGNVGTTIGFNPENVETLGLSQIGFQGRVVVGPDTRRLMLATLMNVTLSANQTNILVNGCLVPESAGSCLGPKGANISQAAITITDIAYLVTEFINKLGGNIKFEDITSDIPDIGIKQAEFYFSPQPVYVFGKTYPQGFRVSGASELFGVSFGLDFLASKDGFEGTGYLSNLKFGDYVALTGTGPDKKSGTADDGPFVSAKLETEKKKIELGLSGDVTVAAGKLGTIRGAADVDVTTSGVKIDFQTQILNQFDSEINLSAPNFKNPTSWYGLITFSQSALDSLSNLLKTAFANLKTPLANLTAQAQQKVNDAKKAYDDATAAIQKSISDAQNQVNSLKSKIDAAAQDCPLISATTPTEIKQAQTAVTQKFGTDYGALISKVSDQIETIVIDINNAKAQNLAQADLDKFTIKRWADAFSSALKSANLSPDNLAALNVWLRQFKEKGVPPSSATNQLFLTTLGLVFAAQANLGEPLFSQGTANYPSFLQRTVELTLSDPDIVAALNTIAQARSDQNISGAALIDLQTTTFTNKFKEIYDRIKPAHLDRSNTLYFLTWPDVFKFIAARGTLDGGKGILDGNTLDTYRAFVALWSAGYDLMQGDEYNLKADYRYFPLPVDIIANAKDMAKNFAITRGQENNPGINSRLSNQAKLGTFILLANDSLGVRNFLPFLLNAVNYVASTVFVTSGECTALGTLCSNNKVTSNPLSYDDYKNIFIAYMKYVQSQTGPFKEGDADVTSALFLFAVPETVTAGSVSRAANLTDGLKYWLASGTKNFALFVANYHSLPLVNSYKLLWNLEPFIAAHAFDMPSGTTSPKMSKLIREKDVLAGLYNTISGNNYILKLEKRPWSYADNKIYGQFP